MTTARLTRSERTAQTRRELLQAAERRFLEHGYHATTLDEVADDAGYTKGAVYSTFQSKAGLFLALFDALIDRRVAEIRSLLDEHPEDFVDALARRPVTADNSKMLLAAIEFWVHAVHEPRLLKELAARHKRLRASIAELAPAGGALAPERWAVVTLALSNGLALERLIDPAGVPGDLMAAVQAQLARPPAA
jgi:AcrR family transcriptional regulator